MRECHPGCRHFSCPDCGLSWDDGNHWFFEETHDPEPPKYASRDDVPDCVACHGEGEVRFSWFPSAPCPQCMGTGKQLEELAIYRRYQQK